MAPEMTKSLHVFSCRKVGKQRGEGVVFSLVLAQYRYPRFAYITVGSVRGEKSTQPYKKCCYNIITCLQKNNNNNNYKLGLM